MSAARGIHSLEPVVQQVSEESPSLWSRVCKCVSEILSQLWEWITSWFVAKPIPLDPDRVSRVFQTAETNLGFSFPYKALCLIQNDGRIERHSAMHVENERDKELFVKYVARKLYIPDKWSLKMILAKDLPNCDPRAKKVVIAQETAHYPYPTATNSSRTGTYFLLNGFLEAEFIDVDPRTTRDLIDFLTS